MATKCMHSCVRVKESQALFGLEPCLACAQANHMIRQEFEFVVEGDKFARLVQLLEREMDGSRLLVFCETKRGCDAVTRQLRQSGWPALSIHGDKSQEERDWVLSVRSETLSHPTMHTPTQARLQCGHYRYCVCRSGWPALSIYGDKGQKERHGCSACGPLCLDTCRFPF